MPKRSGSSPQGLGALGDIAQLLRSLSEHVDAAKVAVGDLPLGDALGDALKAASKQSGGSGGTSSGNQEFTLPGGARGVYGFSIRTGLGDDKPVVNEFGNVKMTQEGVVVSETREPLVDVFEEGAEIQVVFELPGVSEKDIHLELNGDVLALTAQGPRHRYESETLLPAAVDAASANQSYENGYLQVRYTKATAKSPSATEGEPAKAGDDDHE